MGKSLKSQKTVVRAIVSPDLNDKIKTYMAKYGINQSDAIRDALDIFYGMDEKDRDKLMAIALKSRRSISAQGAVMLGDAVRSAKNPEGG